MSNPIFNQIEVRKVDTNRFDLSHDRKMSLDMGWLIPTCVIDTIPGDKFTINTSQMIRFSPLIAPVMHRIKVYTHFWFVPNRLLWPNWEKFITGGEDGNDASVHPYLNLLAGDLALSGLADYMGLPQLQDAPDATVKVNALPFAAYQKIYNEYYRDQNLQSPVDWELTDGLNDRLKFIVKRKRAWQHDYFTSALPWTQKGIEATIPLGAYAPVEAFFPPDNPLVGQSRMRKGTDGTISTDTGMLTIDGGHIGIDNNTTYDVLDNSDNLRVDLSQATSASINELRRAFKLQEWLEKNARGGSRYYEALKNHFGVLSSDARLQRPEYIGGGVSNVVISEVLQTAPPTDAQQAKTPQGNMAGHAINVGGNPSFRFYCEEHGYIIGLMSILPETAYFQGVPKHFSKFDKFDYFWPSFATLGEQPIFNRELYLSGTASDAEIFGYTPRYAEYKFQNNTVHGDFKDSLKMWHMARSFSMKPALNGGFIESDPTERIFAVEADGIDSLYAHVYNQVSAVRKMPVFGTPTI